MPATYKIDLARFEPGAWAEIHCQRTFGVATEVQQAASRDYREYLFKQVELYLVAWSFAGEPSPVAFANLEEHIAQHILTEAHAHYESHAPSEEESKG